jgi:hypothetical protein
MPNELLVARGNKSSKSAKKTALIYTVSGSLQLLEQQGLGF